MTRDVLDRLAATCSIDRLVDTRDRAILLLAFASGGRRRCEVIHLRFDQLTDEPAVPLDPRDPASPVLYGRAMTGGRATRDGVPGWPDVNG